MKNFLRNTINRSEAISNNKKNVIEEFKKNYENLEDEIKKIDNEMKSLISLN